MKKKAAALNGLLILAALLAALLRPGLAPVSAALCAAAAALAGAYGVYSRFMDGAVPDLLRNRKRNYDAILLGSRNPGAALSGGTLNLSNFRRNLYTDVLLVHRWYGFLRREGVLILPVDCGDREYLTGDRISVFDNRFLERVTLLEHGKDMKSIRYFCEEYVKGIPFLFHIGRRRPPGRMRSPSRKRNPPSLKSLAEAMAYLDAFAGPRHFRVRLCLRSYTPAQRAALSGGRYARITLQWE